MAEIKISCEYCGQHIQCDEGYRGLQIKCPNCQQSFLVRPERKSQFPKTELDMHNESHKETVAKITEENRAHFQKLDSKEGAMPQKPTPVGFTSIKAYLTALAVIIVLGFFMCWAIYGLCIYFPSIPNGQPAGQPNGHPTAPDTSVVDLAYLESQVKNSMEKSLATDPSLNGKVEIKNVHLVQIDKTNFNGTVQLQTQIPTGAVTTTIPITVTFDGNTLTCRASQQNAPTNPSVENPQATGIGSATDKGEFAAFFNANVLFNQQDNKNALTAYTSFKKNYPTSPRIPIVEQRMADIQRIINSENAANSVKDEYETIYQRVISSLPNGDSPYPDVFVKGYGSDRLSAFKSAFDSLPADVQGTKGRIHAVEFDGSCCKITFW